MVNDAHNHHKIGRMRKVLWLRNVYNWIIRGE
jgi:hypothetical protein